MANGKNKVVVYADWIKNFEDLEDDELGKLFRHFFEYINDLNPVLEDRILKIAWKPIETTLKRDLKSWDKSVEEKSKNGRIGNLKRYNVDIYNYFLSEKITLEQAEEMVKSRKASQPDKTTSQPVAKLAVSVSDTDTDSVSDTDSVIDNNNIPEIKNFGVDDDLNFNIQHSKILKFESPSWMESVSMQQKIKIEEIEQKIDEFVLFLQTTQTQHKYKKGFVEHFVNWLTKKSKNTENGNKQSFGGNTAKKAYEFSVDRVIETYAGDN